MSRNLTLLILILASALVMFIEIIGAKFLTPIVGGSHISWISQILITLISLSGGAYLSTKVSSFKKLGIILFASSAIFLITLISSNVIIEFIQNQSLSIQTLFLSIVFYGIPLTVLGLSFPLFYKKLLQNNFPLGTISALSTLGSVVGTLASYFAILLGSNLMLLLGSALLMVIMSLIVLRKESGSTKKYEMMLLALIIGAAVSYNKKVENNGSNRETVFFKNTHFGELSVVKEKDTYTVYNDNLVQNAYNKSKQSINLFTYALRVLPLSARTEIKSALVLGLGLGLVAQDLKNLNITTTAVEINSDMIELSKQILNLQIPIFSEDAKTWLKKNQESFDLIVHDVFLVDNVPKYLLSEETFKLIQKHLNHNGILAINTFGITNPHDTVTNSTYATLTAVFKYTKVYSLNEFNVFYLASDEPIEINKLDLSQVPEFMQDKIKKLAGSEIKDFTPVPILKDGISRIEFFDNSPRELYRKTQARHP